MYFDPEINNGNMLHPVGHPVGRVAALGTNVPRHWPRMWPGDFVTTVYPKGIYLTAILA
jgi:hypothetical protein